MTAVGSLLVTFNLVGESGRHISHRIPGGHGEGERSAGLNGRWGGHGEMIGLAGDYILGNDIRRAAAKSVEPP